MSKRIELEPMGRWTTLVVVAHVLAGFGLWYWLAHEIEVAASPGGGTVWMSPADFAAPQAAVSLAVPTEPVATATPRITTPPPAEKVVPKAIAIPANATPEDIAKLLARTPARVPTIPPPPVGAASDTAAAQPMPSATPPPPPSTQAATLPTLPPPPAEIARIITVQHRPAAQPAAPPAAPPPGASLSDIAAYEAAGVGTTGNAKGINMDDMDHAIMKAFTQNWVVQAAFAQLPAEQRTAHMDIAVGRQGQVLNFKMAKSSGNKAFDDSVLAAGNRVENVNAKLPAQFTGERYEFQLNFHAE